MAEGRVASLFVEFRATVDKFADDMKQMSYAVHAFDKVVQDTAKHVKELGNLTGIGQLASVMGNFNQVTAGSSVMIRQTMADLYNLGGQGGNAIDQLAGVMENFNQVTAGSSVMIRQTAAELFNLGGQGGNAIGQLASGMGLITSGSALAVREFTGEFSGGMRLITSGSALAARELVDNLGGGFRQITSGSSLMTTDLANGMLQVANRVGILTYAWNAFASTFFSTIQNISNDLRAFHRMFDPIARLANEIGVALTIGLTVPIVAVGAFAIKTGMDFETAFAGVRKTVQASEEELASLRGELIQLSTQAPVTAVEFAGIAQAAGELGIKTKDIARFSQTVAELKATTRLTADAASNFLGRFTNITQLPQEQIHNLASTMVALGHGFAASEADIAAFGLRIAKTGSVIGLTDAQILAFATALASVGVTAESGGTAISRVFVELAKGVATGGTRLSEFAIVAGVSSKSFSQSFKTDAAGATLKFIEGLKKIKDEGGNVFGVLNTLKLSNIRTRDALLALAAGSDILSDALKIGTDEFQKNGELTRAYGERNKTTASQLKIFKDQVDALGISLFDTLAPAINGSVIPSMKRLVDEGIRPVVEWFNKLPASSQNFAVTMLLIVAAIGPAILIITKLVSLVGGLVIVLKNLGAVAVFKEIGATIGAIFSEISAVAVLAAGATGIGAFIAAITLPLAVPWWLTAGFYGALVLEIYNLVRARNDLIDAQGETARSEAGANVSLFKAIDAMRAHGIAISIVGKSTAQLTTEVVEAGRTYQWFLTAQKNSTDAVEKHGAALKKTEEELLAEAEAAAKLAKEYQNQVDNLVKSLDKNINEQLALAQAIKIAESRHFSATAIALGFADALKQVAENASKTNGAINDGIAPYLALQAQLKITADLHKRMDDAARESADHELKTLLMIEDETGRAFGNLGQFFNFVEDEVHKTNPLLDDNAAAWRRYFTEIDRGVQQSDEAMRVWHQHMDQYITNLPIVAPVIPPPSTTIGGQDWEKWQKDGEQAINNIINDISKMFTDMIGNGKSFWEAFKSLGKSAVAAIADTFLKAMLHSFLDKWAAEFGKWLNKISDKLTSLVKEFGLTIAAGLAGGVIANKVSHGSVAFTVAGAAAGVALGELQRGDPLGAAIAGAVAAGAAIVGILRSFGNTHLQADKFVQQIQNPFGKSLTDIVDAANALSATGKLTYEGALQAQTKIQDMWSGFLEGAAEFGKQGKDQAVVAAQAIATLTPIMNQVFGGLEKQILDLMPPALRVTRGLYDFAEAVSAVSTKLEADKTLGFVEQVINATAGAANLEEALGILENAGTPIAIIVDRLGNDINSFAAALELAGLPIPDLIEKYRNLGDASKQVSGDMPRIANSLSRLVGDAVEKLRNIAGAGDLAGSILGALDRLLTGLPAPVSPVVPSPVTTQINIHIEDNESIVNTFTFTEAISRVEVRDDILPEITEALTNNTGSVREKWIKILGGAWNGVVTIK